MEHKEQDLRNLKRQTIVSTLSLFFQSGYSAVLGLVANIILTIYVSPAIYGMYLTVLSVIAFLNYFSDIGLAASLIQRKKISDDDVKTVFTIQQTLIIAILTIAFFLTPWVISFYDLPQQGRYLYWAVLISFMLSSLKTVPSVFLERRMEFKKIVLVQIVENTLFYICVAACAIAGLELMSFTYGVLLRASIGVTLMYIIMPWRPRIGISMTNARKLLAYGIPMQANSIVALIKDDLMIMFLGKVVGFQTLGYIGWAKKWAEAPIRLIMDSVSRVLFPFMSRIQEDKNKLRTTIERIIYYQTLAIVPAILGMMIIMPDLIHIVPRYSKWEVALPLFYLFCISALLSSYSSPFTNLFNAVGKVRWSLYFMVGWTITTWILTPILTTQWGMYGFPITQVVLSSSFFVVVIVARRLLSFHILPAIYKPIIAALLMTIAAWVLKDMIYDIIVPSLQCDDGNCLVPTARYLSMVYLGIVATISGGLYYGVLRLLGIDIIKEWKQL